MATTVLSPEVESALESNAVSTEAVPPSIALASLNWKTVKGGIPLEKLGEFSTSTGIAMKDLLEVVIPPRTLKHRRQRNERLSQNESDRLVGVARIYELAVKVYGNKDDATEWLVTPKRRFDGQTALSMLRTSLGATAVEEFLIQIDEGMFV
jgi:putative toxin-antitoxin system antitoxin component (TIGR02293 family)